MRQLSKDVFLLLVTTKLLIATSPAIAGTSVYADAGLTGALPGENRYLNDDASGDLVLADGGSRLIGFSASVGCCDVTSKTVTSSVFAAASMASAELKTSASLAFSADQPGGAVMPLDFNSDAAFAFAGLNDSFDFASPTGMPYLWGDASMVTFAFDVSGTTSLSSNLVSDPDGRTNIVSELLFIAHKPGTFDRIGLKRWLIGDFSLSSAQIEYFADDGGYEAVDLSAASNLTYTFNPMGDFDWTIYLLSSVGLDASEQNVAATLDFSHTVNASYIGPAGAVTYSDSGLFPGTLAAPAAVPEPATWAMMIVGFGTIGAAMRRRPVRSVSFAA